MAKLQDMFTQARRGQSGGGIGFLGKSRTESRPHAAALVVEFPEVTAGSAEAALKAGADGLLFTWNGRDSALLDRLKSEIDSARASNEDVLCGLHISGGLDKLDHASLGKIKESGIQYIVLPFDAPAHLLAVAAKDLEKVVTVPARTEEMYPLFIRNLASLDGIAATLLDFQFTRPLAAMTIEEVLSYHAIREATRHPAFIAVPQDIGEADAYTLRVLGVQAVILRASSAEEETRQQVRSLRKLLEQLYQEEKENEDASASSLRRS
ncbi:MAG TPA: hypothetical protein VKV37_00785 [Ktedonobacteraceae bacterium]|jgi:hypothetical protein|nr:hypothetical protein [Ktedonobacteraceae bacterium]